MSKNKTMPGDPLANPAFKKPGLLEQLAGTFLGVSRPLDCVQIEVTSHCGNACIYCPQTTQHEAWQRRHMPAEIFARLWPLLRQSSRAHLQGWGEPLLHPRFFDFQALAAKAGCLTSTTSCGLLMDEEKAMRLAVSGMDLIAFSLAGTDEETNHARQGASFASVCASVRMLRKAIRASKQNKPLEIHFAYLMLADRMQAAARLPELMDELDVEMTVVSTLDYLATPAQRDLAFWPGDYKKIGRATDILLEAAARAEQLGRIIHFALPGKKPAASGCRENVGHAVYVAANGDISPCVYLNVPGSDPAKKRRVFGNVGEEEPLTIWRKPEFKAFRQKLLGGEAEEVCANCPKRLEEEDQTAQSGPINNTVG